MTGAVGLRRVPKSWLEQQTIPLPEPDEQRKIVAEIEKQFTRLEAGVAALRRVQANLKRYRAAVLKAACEGRLVPNVAAASRRSPAGKQSGSGVPPLKQEEQSRDGSATLSATFETGAQLLARILTERRQNWQGRGQYTEPTAPDTVNLPPLPEGWTWATLEQLAVFKNGINFSAAQKGQKGVLTIDVLNMYSTGIHVDLANLYRVDLVPEDHQLLREGDVLFVRSSVRREGVGYACLFKEASEPVAFCGFIIRGRLNTKELLLRFVAYFLRSHSAREQIIKSASQVTITNVSQAALGKLPVPLPPRAEQTRIVAEVERRLSVVEELESVVTANLQRAVRLRQSILQKAFTGELV